MHALRFAHRPERTTILATLAFAAACLVGCGWEDPPPPLGRAGLDAAMPVARDATVGDPCSPLASCGGACVDPTSDPAHCGGCDRACAADEVCSGGACASECAGALTPCAGACVDTSTSTTHCGGCGAPCGAGEECAGGACRCAAGTTACGGACVDTTTDAAHCGGAAGATRS